MTTWGANLELRKIQVYMLSTNPHVSENGSCGGSSVVFACKNYDNITDSSLDIEIFMSFFLFLGGGYRREH